MSVRPSRCWQERENKLQASAAAPPAGSARERPGVAELPESDFVARVVLQWFEGVTADCVTADSVAADCVTAESVTDLNLYRSAHHAQIFAVPRRRHALAR